MALEIFRLIGSVFVNTEDAEKSLHKTDEKAGNMGKTLLNGVGHAAKWGAAVVGAAAGVGAKFIDMAADAESAFAKVQTLLDTDTDMDAYYKSIMDASNQTGVAFSDFSESVYSAISASIDAADAVDFTTEAVKLAKGGFTETSTAVDVLTTAINAYGMSADDASHISDVLIGVQNAGKTTVDELSSSLGKVIPIANANNVTFEEMGAMYAVMTKNGIATAEAGTGIKAMLSELGKTGSKSDQALKALTKSVYGEAMGFKDLQEKGYSTDQALALVTQAAEKSGKSLSDMFGSVEAGNTALTLMKDGGKELADLNNELATSAGAAGDAFDTMGQTFSEKMAIIKNRAANAAIELGEHLMPLGNQVADWVMEHMPEIQAVIQVAFDVLAQVVQTAGKWISWLFGTFQQYMPQIQAIVKLVFDKVKQFWNNELKPVLQQIGTFIKDVLAPAFKQVFEHIILPVVQAVFRGISQLWTGTLKPILTGIIDFITGVFTGNWRQAFEGLSRIVSGVFNGFVSIVKAPLNAVIGIVNSFIGGLNKLKIPDWIPVVGGKGVNISKIPLLAAGGVLEKGQTGYLEGNGAEAVVPLENNKKWISAVARDMESAVGSGKSTELLAAILKILEKLEGMGIYLDGDKLVGGLAKPLDKKLGMIAAQKARA